ncbi:hypothetical protein AAZX31_17G124000 [Glycine max]
MTWCALLVKQACQCNIRYDLVGVEDLMVRSSGTIIESVILIAPSSTYIPPHVVPFSTVPRIMFTIRLCSGDLKPSLFFVV